MEGVEEEAHASERLMAAAHSKVRQAWAAESAAAQSWRRLGTVGERGSRTSGCAVRQATKCAVRGFAPT